MSHTLFKINRAPGHWRRAKSMMFCWSEKQLVPVIGNVHFKPFARDFLLASIIGCIRGSGDVCGKIFP